LWWLWWADAKEGEKAKNLRGDFGGRRSGKTDEEE